jgi:hypothetical protein
MEGMDSRLAAVGCSSTPALLASAPPLALAAAAGEGGGRGRKRVAQVARPGGEEQVSADA